ncbi:MAG: cytochrome c [Anaerolineae bacterium]|nr:cytochrome c [Anaerolineae bacterium]
MPSIYERRIILGLAFITATIILVGWLAINENGRMQEFTERAEGRSIEQGARLFEANCASCHGYDGYGLPGIAPALNNPHLFGHNFFGELDNQIAATQSQLTNETDAERRGELEARLVTLQAERTAIEERIYYDWTDQVGARDPETECTDADTTISPVTGYSPRQLCELGAVGVQLLMLDEQIIQLEGITSAAALPVYISQVERDQLAPLLAERDNLLAIQEGTSAEGEASAEGETAAPA